MRKNEYPDFSQVVAESACSILNNPGVLSEYFIAEALERRHKGAINIKDARELIEDYLTALCESRPS
jgi:hypothetical protein